MEELNDLLKQRRAKLTELNELGYNPFANDFKSEHTCADVSTAHADDDTEALEGCETQYAVGGRIMAQRDFIRIASPKPGISTRRIPRIASGVTSRSATPVPPVVRINPQPCAENARTVC